MEMTPCAAASNTTVHCCSDPTWRSRNLTRRTGWTSDSCHPWGLGQDWPLPITAQYSALLQYTTVHHCAPQYITMHHHAPLCTTVHHRVPPCTTVHHHAPSSTTVHHCAPPCTRVHQLLPLCGCSSVHTVVARFPREPYDFGSKCPRQCSRHCVMQWLCRQRSVISRRCATGPYWTGCHQTGCHQTGGHQTGSHQTGGHQTGGHLQQDAAPSQGCSSCM